MNEFFNFYSTVYYQKKSRISLQCRASNNIIIGGVATMSNHILWFVVAFQHLQRTNGEDTQYNLCGYGDSFLHRVYSVFYLVFLPCLSKKSWPFDLFAKEYIRHSAIPTAICPCPPRCICGTALLWRNAMHGGEYLPGTIDGSYHGPIGPLGHRSDSGCYSVHCRIVDFDCRTESPWDFPG